MFSVDDLVKEVETWSVWSWVGLGVGVIAVFLLALVSRQVFRELWYRAALSRQGVQPIGMYIPFVGDGFTLMGRKSSDERIQDGDRCTTAPERYFLLEEWMKECGKVNSMTFVGTVRLQSLHASHLGDVLMKKADCFEKPPGMRGYFGGLLGSKSILIAGADVHKSYRKALNPAFHHEVLKYMVGGIRTCAEDAIVSVLSRAKRGEKVDMFRVLMNTTLDVIGQASFGGLDDEKTEEEEDEVIRETTLGIARRLEQNMVMTQDDIQTLRFIIPGYYRLPTERNALLQRNSKEMMANAMQVIKQREQQSKQSSIKTHEPRFLDRMFEGAKEAKEDLEWIKGQCLTFIAAGHETTSIALSWTLVLLTQHPEWKQRLFDEIDHAVRSSSSPASFPSKTDLDNLPILTAIFNESLRIYPPIPMVSRVANDDVTIGTPGVSPQEGGAIHLPKGTSVHIHIHQIHRDPSRFLHPHIFDPSRFLEDSIIADLGLTRISDPSTSPTTSTAMPYLGKRPPTFDFVPFVAGSRSCIGQRLALLEAQVILAVFARRMDWSLKDAGYIHNPDLNASLRPKHGVPLTITPRK